jgi:PKD domain
MHPRSFESSATNLIVGDGNGELDVFIRDRAAGQTTRASVTPASADPADASVRPALSGDGRIVAFSSASPDLVSPDTNAGGDLFLRTLGAGVTTRASVDNAGNQVGASNPFLAIPALSDTGRFAAFTSDATGLVPGDGNGAVDVFLRDTGANTSPTAGLSSATDGAITTLDAAASVDPDGWIDEYRWTFGDGATATTSTPRTSHAYATGAAVLASVQIVDNDGATAQASAWGLE